MALVGFLIMVLVTIYRHFKKKKSEIAAAK